MSQLSDFWKNFKPYGDTCIAEQDYEILKKANLLVSKDDWKMSGKETSLHSHLHAEPFVGNLNADIYIMTANPGVSDDEYNNWENNTLNKLADNCINQGPTKYPFYYLDPKLAGTGGALYWLEKVDMLPNGKKQHYSHHKFFELVNELEKKYGSRDAAIQKIAQNVCDLEFCPYHSKNWDPNNICSLPSVKAMIDFLKTIVVPGVINGTKTLIVGRNVRLIDNALSSVDFDYNGKKIKFDDLDKLFPDNVVFYRTRVLAQPMLLNSKSPAWSLLLKKL